MIWRYPSYRLSEPPHNLPPPGDPVWRWYILMIVAEVVVLAYLI